MFELVCQQIIQSLCNNSCEISKIGRHNLNESLHGAMSLENTLKKSSEKQSLLSTLFLTYVRSTIVVVLPFHQNFEFSAKSHQLVTRWATERSLKNIFKVLDEQKDCNFSNDYCIMEKEAELSDDSSYCYANNNCSDIDKYLTASPENIMKEPISDKNAYCDEIVTFSRAISSIVSESNREEVDKTESPVIVNQLKHIDLSPTISIVSSLVECNETICKESLHSVKLREPPRRICNNPNSPSNLGDIPIKKIRKINSVCMSGTARNIKVKDWLSLNSKNDMKKGGRGRIDCMKEHSQRGDQVNIRMNASVSKDLEKFLQYNSVRNLQVTEHNRKALNIPFCFCPRSIVNSKSTTSNLTSKYFRIEKRTLTGKRRDFAKYDIQERTRMAALLCRKKCIEVNRDISRHRNSLSMKL